MSGTLADSIEEINTQTAKWVKKYDQESSTLCRNRASALRGVRDFGLEEAAYFAARGVVKIVEDLDEIYEDEQVQVNEDGDEVAIEVEVRGVNGRLIIPGHGRERPMRVVRERRSAPVVGQMEKEMEEDLGSCRSGKEGVIDGKMGEGKDGGVDVQEMPEAAFKRSFFGSLKGLRDGAVARLGLRKDEKKVVGSDVEADEEKPITPKKK